MFCRGSANIFADQTRSVRLEQDLAEETTMLVFLEMFPMLVVTAEVV